MKKLIATVSFLLISSVSLAAFPSKMYIVGKSRNLTSDTVEIETTSGVIKVPRSTVVRNKRLREGQKTIAHVSWTEIIESNRDRPSPRRR